MNSAKGPTLHKTLLYTGILIVISVGIWFLAQRSRTPQSDSLRVAWMTSWATAGQVVEALKHTDILQENGIDADFTSFLFGPPMNEAALAGAVDVTIVGDMPAIILLANSEEWAVVSRTIYFPYALVVRSDLDIESFEDLKEHTIGVPFGSGPQPTLYRWLDEAALEIGEDVRVVNLLPNEIGEAIAAHRVDAAMVWEPTFTLLLDTGSVKILREARGVGFMCMSKRFIESNEAKARGFIKAWKSALLYVSQNRGQTDQWFSEDSRFDIDLLNRIRVVDDNFNVSQIEEIDLALSDLDILTNQVKSDFAFQQGLIDIRLDVKKRLIPLWP